MLLVCFPLNSLNIKELLFSDNSTGQMMYDKEVTHYDQHFSAKNFLSRARDMLITSFLVSSPSLKFTIILYLSQFSSISV